MKSSKLKSQRRKKIHWRVRSKVYGTAERPRLTVYRSNKAIYCQIINDDNQEVITGANSLKISDGNKVDKSFEVGKMIAEKAKSKNIEHIVFDRGGYLYHGRVKAVADGAREGGLKF